MTYRDEIVFELWRAPRVLLFGFLAPFGAFFLWAVYLFVSCLPNSWTYAVAHPGVAIQWYFASIWHYAVSWLPFTLSVYFFRRQAIWLWYRLSVGRTGITYEVTESGITNEYGKGPTILMPWANVKSLARTNRLLLLRSDYQGWWYLPWQAFDAASQEQLWAYAQQHVAGASKSPTASV
ncbi:hypothetical protein HU675_0008380 [Bradyrhizobium septentrionale]|uniref:hypothetical protein n=1 Tax=Bradyrhizobium septentrionale TaxID=1404411 RepID=UPI001596B431|nr:hypothetical protein [Bradyrhizobium septentrionale]UGY26754.1 hypothetical protein HU675_0008380 [Bradyrhizobium septentrionale]